MQQENSSAYPASAARRARYSRAALAIGLSVLLLLTLGVALAAAAQPSPDATATGTVVVQFGDHDLAARAISFTAPISGLTAL